jgi:hypothetical protein
LLRLAYLIICAERSLAGSHDSNHCTGFLLSKRDLPRSRSADIIAQCFPAASLLPQLPQLRSGWGQRCR